MGTDIEKIIYNLNELLVNEAAYKKMSQAHNPYGDGYASKRIIEKLAQKL